MAKYKIKMSDLDKTGGIHKFERDGFKRAEIMKRLHQETRGASREEKQEIVERLFDRREK